MIVTSNLPTARTRNRYVVAAILWRREALRMRHWLWDTAADAASGREGFTG